MSEGGDLALRAADLCYAYGDRVAVDRVSFPVARREILGSSVRTGPGGPDGQAPGRHAPPAVRGSRGPGPGDARQRAEIPALSGPDGTSRSSPGRSACATWTSTPSCSPPHDRHEADELSDRVAFIDDGVILALDTPEQLELAHGERAVRVRRRAGGQVEETVVSLVGDAGPRTGCSRPVPSIFVWPQLPTRLASLMPAYCFRPASAVSVEPDSRRRREPRRRGGPPRAPARRRRRRPLVEVRLAAGRLESTREQVAAEA